MGLKRTVADLLDTHPRLYLPAVRLLAAGKYDLPGPYTELVISGYPRSANSFATRAVWEAQQRPIEIASHLHAAAEAIEAVRRGLPTIVLIRRPEDAIRSLKAAEPDTDENRELKRWIRYYGTVEPLHPSFVISPFERTVGDFGSVLEEVNDRFATRFRRFEPTDEFRERVFEGLQHSQDRFGTHHLAGEPGDRAARVRGVTLAFDAQRLAEANNLYRRFEDMSGWRRS